MCLSWREHLDLAKIKASLGCSLSSLSANYSFSNISLDWMHLCLVNFYLAFSNLDLYP